MKLTTRPARLTDKAPLMSFIKDVWGGHDYIPRVWDEWIGDPSAKIFVAEAEGRAIAMNRVKLLEDGSAWLEGVRVHPGYRRMGVASALGKRAMEYARDRNASVFRLTSGSRNRASHLQVATLGFAEVARFSLYEASEGRRFRSQTGVKVAARGDFGSVRRAIEASREYRLGGDVVWDGFTATALTPAVLRKRIRTGAVYLCDGAVAVRVAGREGSDLWNQVGYISGGGGPAMKLVDHIFGQEGRFAWRFVTVPQGSGLVGELRRHGLKRSFSIVLFEKKAANG